MVLGPIVENGLTASDMISDASAAMKMHDDEADLDANLVGRWWLRSSRGWPGCR